MKVNTQIAPKDIFFITVPMNEDEKKKHQQIPETQTHADSQQVEINRLLPDRRTIWRKIIYSHNCLSIEAGLIFITKVSFQIKSDLIV